MTDAPPTTGLHHVTNICTDGRATREFYEDVLGWYTVQRTQNYDGLGSEEIDPIERGYDRHGEGA